MDAITFHLKDLRKLKGSLVYQVMRKGKVIYIGRSNVGIDRPLETFHPAMSQCLKDDLVKLIFCKSAYEAAKLETKLIQQHCPILNVRKPKHKTITIIKGGSCP